MTIHKSQGSEFENVLMILPDRDSQVLTRELVYTGVIRARKTLWIWAEQDVLKVACSRRIARRSGLRDALWLMSNA
jgi:exodeoxyribonuclease V alpha subunit